MTAKELREACAKLEDDAYQLLVASDKFESAVGWLLRAVTNFNKQVDRLNVAFPPPKKGKKSWEGQRRA